MPLYAVNAFTAEDRAVRHQIQAASAEAAHVAVRALGLFPSTVVEKRGLFHDPKRLKLSRREMIELFVHMEMQLSSGIIVVEAVAALKDSLPSLKLQYVLREVYEQLTSSRADLTNALRLFPRSFPIDILTVIHAGEETASLPERFAELRDRLEFTASMRQTITRAVQYPAFVSLLGTSMIVFFLGRIVPQLAQLLKELNAPLPTFTLRVIAISDWFKSYWTAVILGLALLPIGYIYARRWQAFALGVDRLFLKLVVIGGIYRQLSAALIARIYRSLYLAEKTPHEALDLCASLVNNLAVAAALRQMKRHISDGDTLAQAFGRTGVFPAEACAIVASGERSGRLDHALQRISSFYSEEGRRRITGLSAWIGPVAILFIGSFVGTVLIAMFLPFFNLIKVIR
jgi:type II secretory pathway component PulF